MRWTRRSGNMYAGLDERGSRSPREVTRMVFPPQSWFGYKTMGVHAFGVLYPGIVQADPQYFKRLLARPGLSRGANPPDSLIKARIQHRTTIRLTIAAAEADKMGWRVNHSGRPGRGRLDKGMAAMQDSAAQIPSLPTRGYPAQRKLPGGGSVDPEWRCGG